MDDLRWSEAVEPRRRRIGVGADVFRVDQAAVFQLRQFFRLRVLVYTAARLPDYRPDLRRASLDHLHAVLAVIEYDPGVGVVHAVIDVVAALPVAHRFTDDTRDCRGGARYQKPARLSQDFDILREQAVDLGVDLPGQHVEGLHGMVVGYREAASDVEDLDLMAAGASFVHDRRRDIQRLHEIVEVGALAPHVEAHSLHHQPDSKRFQDQIHRLTGVTAKLGG